MSDTAKTPRTSPAKSKPVVTSTKSKPTPQPSRAASDKPARVSPYAGFTPLSPSDEKLWAALINLGGVFLYFVAPLVGYLLLRQRGPFVREHAVSALNWQLSLLLYYFVSSILFLLLIGYLLALALLVINVVFSIIAAIHAHRGQLYSYPLSIKFIRV